LPVKYLVRRKDYGQKSIVYRLENPERRFRLVLFVFDYRRVDTNSLFQKHRKTVLLYRHDIFYSALYLFDSRLRLEFGEKVRSAADIFSPDLICNPS
jgi:hypothetical protein